MSELFLVDTSVWLEVLPSGRGAPVLRQRVQQLLAADRVAVTGMVRLELLGGASSDQEWTRLEDALAALHPLEVTEIHWDTAARSGFQLRRQGVTIPYTDLLISAVAMEAGAVVVHRDRHFDLAASYLPLKVESYI